MRLLRRDLRRRTRERSFLGQTSRTQRVRRRTVSVADPSSLCVIVILLVSDLLFSIVADPEIVTLIETDADLDFDDSSELVTDVVSGDEEVRDIDEEASRLKVTDIVVLALFDTESNDVGLIDRDGSSVAEPDGLPDIVSESSLDSSCVRDAEFGLAVIVVSELGEEELVIVKDVVLVRRLASTEQAKSNSTRDMTILTMYNLKISFTGNVDNLWDRVY